MRPSILLVPVLALAACAPSYVYQPATNATAQIRGRVAAEYQIPAAQPRGDVRLASFGFSNVSSTRAPNERERAVHVRMVVANNSAQPWTVDTREQRLDLPGRAPMPPAYVHAHEGDQSLPYVTVPAGGKRTIDLFYPLPPELQSAQHLPEFDVVWRVHTEDQTVVERTPFDRLRITPVYAAGYGPGWVNYGPWWGGPFWYDPWYPVGVLPPAYVGVPATIGPPTWAW